MNVFIRSKTGMNFIKEIIKNWWTINHKLWTQSFLTNVLRRWGQQTYNPFKKFYKKIESIQTILHETE